MENQHYQEAIKILKTIQEKHPHGLEHLPEVMSSLLAIALYGSGDEENARPYLQEFLELEESASDTFRAVAQRLMAMEKMDLAAQTLEKALARYPKDAKLHFLWVKLQVARGETEKIPESLTVLLNTRYLELELLAEAQRLLNEEKTLPSKIRKTLLPAIQARLDRWRSVLRREKLL